MIDDLKKAWALTLELEKLVADLCAKIEEVNHEKNQYQKATKAG